MNEKPILVIDSVEKSFPGVKALSDVSLDLRQGEVHAVCGENGAGKSTLMKIICGVYQPDGGKMFLNGEDYSIQGPNDAYARGIAIIYQESSLFPDLTVLDNIFMGHEIQKLMLPFLKFIKINDYPSMRRRASAIFERLGMDIDLDAIVSNLGVATKQMIEIAKALTFDSPILILDEPTAALTSKEVDTLFETIRKLKSEGHSMLYISHRLDEIFEVCDRVTVLRDGQFIKTEDVVKTDKDELVSWMVGRNLDNLYPKTEVDIGGVIFEAKGLNQEGILHNIDFNLRKGEILGIAGLAGAGRTELALAVCGLTKLDSGKLNKDGKEVSFPNYRSAQKHGIDYISEDRKAFGLVLEMSVKVNLTQKLQPKISNSIGIIRRNEEDSYTDDYIKKLGIKTPDGDFIVENLSGGNQQKVSVAKSLAIDPEILILDEPTRGVDVGAKSELHRIISNRAADGRSIILISSDLPEILGMCDRVFVMKNGRMAGEVMRDEMSQEKILGMAL